MSKLDELLKKYEPDMYGIFEVVGEDPNCDFGGHHHRPTLGYFEGYYSDICEHAVTLNNFFTWGSGGDVKLAPKTIQSAKLIGDYDKIKQRNENINNILNEVDVEEFLKLKGINDSTIRNLNMIKLIKLLIDFKKKLK